MRDAVGAVQSILVLGGGSDIGIATVRALLGERAATVILAGRHPDQLDGPAADLRGAGAERVEVIAFDADDTASHAAVFDDVFGRHGDIDLVLVAFGLLGERSQSTESALSVLRTNVVGAASVTLCAVERMKVQGHGTIVVLSSVAGERVRKSNYAYGASKAGIDGFAQGLGDSLAGTGVEVMVVRPGFVHTKMTAGLKAPPFSTTPEQVAEVVVEGLRRRAHTVWAPPVLRWVMLVARLLPRAVFRRLDL